jgi:glucokinase
MTILAGDIGGTNTRLAICEHPETLTAADVHTFPSRDHASLGEVVEKFLAGAQAPALACFGVAGPVTKGRGVVTNLPWVVDAAEMSARFGAKVAVINDLEANAYGLPTLAPTAFTALNDGASDPVGNLGLISAGTGLGEAGLFWDGRTHRPWACEGGHTSFAPDDELEEELLRWRRRDLAHVSWERFVSGPGLVTLYEFLRETKRGEEPAWLAEELREEDPGASISKAALAGTSELAVKALDLFVDLYGAEAGNLALKVMASGGLYVGGGIAPRIIAKLRGGAFMKRFVAKGRMQPLLEAMPVRVVLDDLTALRGSFRRAELLEGE